MAEASDVEVGFAPDSDTAKRVHKLANHVVDDIAKLYTLGDELGRGRFSVVHSAVHIKEKAKYAVKVVENKSLADEENLEALETEIDILRQLSHPHIVALKEVVVATTDTYIVMELLSGGELFNRIVDVGPFSEADASALFAQILLSMEYLHQKDIVHRDVKPENILYLTEGATAIKLIDFGYAGVWAPDKQLTGLCGTPDYVAPEVLTWYEDDENGTPYGKGSDLWSLGVLLYVCLSGCSPFSADEEEEILKLVADAKYEFHEAEWGSISDGAKDVVRKLLVVDPEARLTMEGLLSHPWLKPAVDASRKRIAEAAKSSKANGSKASAPAAKAAGAPSGSAPKAVGAADTVPVETVGEKGPSGGGCCIIS